MPPGMTGLAPSFVGFTPCTNVLIEGVTVRFGPFWMLHPCTRKRAGANVNIVSCPTLARSRRDPTAPFTRHTAEWRRLQSDSSRTS